MLVWDEDAQDWVEQTDSSSGETAQTGLETPDWANTGDFSNFKLSDVTKFLSGKSPLGVGGQLLGLGGIGALLNNMLGSSGSGSYAGYKGGIPQYTAQRTQYALPVTPLPADQQAKVTDESIKNFMGQQGLGSDRMARAMYKYGITPERMAGITSLPVADITARYNQALGPNQSLANPVYGTPGRRPGSGGVTYFSPMQYTPVAAPATPATPATPIETVQAAGGGMMYSSGGALRYNGEDGSVVGAATPNYEQLVRDAYATVGRTGVGEGAAQIDQGGFDFWTNALSSGALSAADLNNQFGAAVNAYIAEKPEDKYTQQIQNYRADQLANTNATTGGVADLITTGNMGAATTGGIADLTGAMTNANTGAATMGNAASTGAATMRNAATMGAATPALSNYNIDAFGDSTTYGYNAGNQLTDNMVTSAQNTLGEGYTVNNMGVNSTTVGDLINNVDESNRWANSLANNSGVVVLNYGLNEASRGESLESFRNNLLTAINQAKAAGKQVILQTPNAVGSDISYGGNVGAYADVIRDVAGSTGSRLDDKFAYTSGRGDIFDATTGDTLHPGGSMYTTLGRNLANTISGSRPATGTTPAARGGLMGYAGGGGISSLGSYSDGGQLLRGPGDGVSDDIPATIGNRQPARLADGEFVVPARIVSELGNGSTDAGARKLYAMMDRIKASRSKAKNIAANTKAYKHLPA